MNLFLYAEIHLSLWIFHNRLHLQKKHQHFFPISDNQTTSACLKHLWNQKWPKRELGSIKSKLHSREQANFLISCMLCFIERWSPLGLLLQKLRSTAFILKPYFMLKLWSFLCVRSSHQKLLQKEADDDGKIRYCWNSTKVKNWPKWNGRFIYKSMQ